MRRALCACAALGVWGGVSSVPAAAADLAEPVFGSTETFVEPSMAGGVRRMSLAAARAQAEASDDRSGSMYGFDASEFDDVGRVEFDVARVAGAIGMRVDTRQAPLFGRVALQVVDDSRVGGHPTVTDADDPYVRNLERSRRSVAVDVYDVGVSPSRMSPQRGLRLDYAQAISGALPGELEVAVEPRANVLVDRDVSGVGGGAIVRFGRNLSSPREDDKGWYAFVGADTQALTWSFGSGRNDARDLRLEDKQMVGDYQVGVARKLGEGDLSIGFVHREVKWQDASRNEQFLGVSYAVRH